MIRNEQFFIYACENRHKLKHFGALIREIRTAHKTLTLTFS